MSWWEEAGKVAGGILGAIGLSVGTWAAVRRQSRPTEKEPESLPPISLTSSHSRLPFREPHATVGELHNVRMDLERKIEDFRRECYRNSDESREAHREQLRDVMDFARELARLIQDLEKKVEALNDFDSRTTKDNIRRRGSSRP